jgi:hypothetical protein
MRRRKVVVLPRNGPHVLVESVTTTEKIELVEAYSIGCLHVVEVVPQFDRPAGQRSPAWDRAEARPPVRCHGGRLERPGSDGF